MDKMDYWRLCDEFTVVQATLLILGLDPSNYPDAIEYQEEFRPENFTAVLSALTHAILGGRLPATIRRESWERGWDEEGGGNHKFSKSLHLFPDTSDFPDEATTVLSRGIIYRASPDWDLTTVMVDDLRVWLRGRGFTTGFFFPESKPGPEYLNPEHPNYANKLAAAVQAWIAVTSEPRYQNNGKSVKQNLENWLTANAEDLSLVNADGEINKHAIEEQISKVANWQEKGGAPKTPGSF